MEENTSATNKDLRELSDQLTEAMRNIQAEILRIFRNWIKPTDIKLKSHEERIALLEERLYDIERGRQQ